MDSIETIKSCIKLYYQLANNKIIGQNRDNNSVNNMIKIVNSYIKSDYKPKPYIRGTKICINTFKVF